MNVKKTYCIVEAPSNCGSHYDCWKEITEGFNRSDLSLKAYCKKKFTEEMNKK